MRVSLLTGWAGLMALVTPVMSAVIDLTVRDDAGNMTTARDLGKRLNLHPSCGKFGNVAGDIATASLMATKARDSARYGHGQYFQHFFGQDNPTARGQVGNLFEQIVNSFSSLNNGIVTVRCDDPCGWCENAGWVSATGTCNGGWTTSLCDLWNALPETAACGSLGRPNALIHENSIVWGATDHNPNRLLDTYTLQYYAQAVYINCAI